MGRSMGSHEYVATLKGQTLRFPNLAEPVKNWPKGMSPHLEVLTKVQHLDLLQLLGPGKAFEICESTDCPYFACTWWPKADYNALRFAAQFITFLYLWDDDTDNPELTNLVSDLEASVAFRGKSIAHFKRFLADDPPQGQPNADSPPVTLRSFDAVGEGATFRMTRGQRLKFLDELVKYMDACDTEQRSEMSGIAPTIDEYLPCRMGTSAAGAVVAILEYMLKVDLGETIRNDPDVKTVFDETVLLIAVMNDLFSLKRELRYPFFNNAVAVLYHAHQNLQSATDEVYKIILTSVEKFEAAADRALQRYPKRRDDLEIWIEGAKTMVTGNMTWSMYIRRYSLDITALDGASEVTI